MPILTNLALCFAVAAAVAGCAPGSHAEPVLPPGYEFVERRSIAEPQPDASTSAPHSPELAACEPVRNQYAAIECDSDQIVVTVPVSFHPGRSIPPEPAKSALDAVAELLRSRPEILLVRVEGWGSAAPGRSLAQRRREIDESQRRADAVLAYLWRRGKISAERLEAVGFGYDPRFAERDQRWPIVLRIMQRARSEVPHRRAR